jgi:RimJ/RimL family protein N-acetyltransferase
LEYKCLSKKVYSSGRYSLIPIRFEDRYNIMQWRNEQIYHLRQAEPLTKEKQDGYFENVVAKLFDQEQPTQILFSLLEGDKCIGYGGLVHINWIDKNAEISFIMETALEMENFESIWLMYLSLIEDVAFNELKIHKIYTYAFDLRPKLYKVLSKANFIEDARLKEHAYFSDTFIDVVIHSKIQHSIQLRKANLEDIQTTFNWATNEEVRKYSFNKSTILFDEHKKWFESKLIDPNCFYYIMNLGTNMLGSIRVDFDFEKEVGIISYLISPDFHGKGFGKILLEKIEDELLKDINSSTITLTGLVLEENKASIKIFEKLNYHLALKDKDVLTFSKTIK